MGVDAIRADVKRARELDAMSSPGPWLARDSENNRSEFVTPSGVLDSDSPFVWQILVGGPEGYSIVQGVDDYSDAERWSNIQRDLTFVAESRTLLPRLAAHCERLLAENAEYAEGVAMSGVHNTAVAALKRVAELEAALKPFAAFVANFPDTPDRCLVAASIHTDGREGPSVTFGDCRRAAALLAESEGKS